jgi:hypothetical protein
MAKWVKVFSSPPMLESEVYNKTIRKLLIHNEHHGDGRRIFTQIECAHHGIETMAGREKSD